MPETTQIKSIRTTFRILELLRESEGSQVTGIASELDLAKSTVSRHLSTLEADSYVVEENGVYFPSLKFLRLGQFTQRRKSIYDVAKPVVEDIAEETGERVQFIVLEHNSAVTLHFETGERGVLTDTELGQRLPLHATSAGKVILSQLSDKELDEKLNTLDFRRETEETITTRDELLAEIEEIRARGYSLNEEEYIDRLHGVSTSVVDEQNGVHAALTISGPAHRLTGDWFREELPDILLGYANEIELKITYPE